MVNPPFSGKFKNFIIEIFDGNSPIVVEKYVISSEIEIFSGDLLVELIPSNLFRLSGAKYGFNINLINKVDSNGKLIIDF